MMDVLILGVKEEINQAVQKMLQDVGVTATNSTNLDNAHSEFNAEEFKAICLGGGLSTETRASLKAAFKQRNPGIGIVETFAPVATAHVLRTLEEQKGDSSLAKDFQVTQQDNHYHLSFTLNDPSPIRIELYQIRNEQPVANILTENAAPQGSFSFSFPETSVLPNLNLIVVSINNNPYFFRSIN